MQYIKRLRSSLNSQENKLYLFSEISNLFNLTTFPDIKLFLLL